VDSLFSRGSPCESAAYAIGLFGRAINGGSRTAKSDIEPVMNLIHMAQTKSDFTSDDDDGPFFDPDGMYDEDEKAPGSE
jgi:hypothetical protein